MDVAQCPFSQVEDLLDTEFLAMPFDTLSALRDRAPVANLPGTDLYLVSHYDDLTQVFRDRDTYSSLKATDPFFPVCEAARAILASGFPRKPTFTNCDPPRHPKMRQFVAQCLTPERWARSQPAVRAFAIERVDALARKPVADLVADLMYPLPAFAGFALLGFPPEDTDRIKEWCVHRVLLTYGKLSEADQVRAARELTSFWEYVRAHVARRAEHPGDDLTSDLLALSRSHGHELDMEDVINMIYSIALAAHETSQNAILNGLLRILGEREHWSALCQDSTLIPNAVEELLRLETPVMVLRRRATRDATLHGVHIPAGSRLLLLPASGNHDGAHFPQPEVLDLKRRNAREHLTFGKQWHFCLGSPLARFEYALVLELLTTRTPRMRLLPGQTFNYLPTMQFRVLERLLVEPEPAA